jgi:hypothetical protein
MNFIIGQKRIAEKYSNHKLKSPVTNSVTGDFLFHSNPVNRYVR